MQGTYTRWTRTEGKAERHADLLGLGVEIVADGRNAKVGVFLDAVIQEWDADTARMIGVRLIEAAALCSADKVTRVIPNSEG